MSESPGFTQARFSASRLPADAVALLPHKGKMCCIDTLVVCREDAAEALAALRSGHALLDATGRMNPFGFIELAAQTAAAMHGFQAGENRPGLAMLVGVQKFTASGTARRGDMLRITVSVLGGIEDMLSLGFSVGKDNSDGQGAAPLAVGRLSVFVPKANDARLAAMPRSAFSGAETATSDHEAGIPQNLPDSIGHYIVDGPSVDENSEGKKVVETTFSFTPGFPGFDGHFPGNPIVPGIVQLMAAAHAVSPDSSADVESLGRCKFLRPAVPGEKIRARVDVNRENSALLCRARLDVDDEPCTEAGFVLRMPPC